MILMKNHVDRQFADKSGLRFGVSIIAAALLLAGCGGSNTSSGSATSVLPRLSSSPIVLGSGLALGKPTWPDDPNAIDGPIAGVGCLENQDYHRHAHLSIFKDAERVAIPAGIGLGGCVHELHTHDSSGIIHIEAASQRNFTLGQLFAVWGQPLSNTNVAGFVGLPVTVFVVDGAAMRVVNEGLGEIELSAHRSISIVIGRYPEELPSYVWPSEL